MTALKEADRRPRILLDIPGNASPAMMRIADAFIEAAVQADPATTVERRTASPTPVPDRPNGWPANAAWTAGGENW